MALLLDSDIDIDWLEDALTEDVASQLATNGRAISVIALMEVLEGTREGDRVAIGKLSTLVLGTTILPMTVRTAYAAAAIRRKLRENRAQVSPRALDILIAATAIEHNLFLVTRNIRHFQDIDGLRNLTKRSKLISVIVSPANSDITTKYWHVHRHT